MIDLNSGVARKRFLSTLMPDETERGLVLVPTEEPKGELAAELRSFLRGEGMMSVSNESSVRMTNGGRS